LPEHFSNVHPAGDLAWKIAEGRGPMPGWKDWFSDTEIWHLVNFIQSLGGQ
jgi:mono/diheme cytochrome c family protein